MNIKSIRAIILALEDKIINTIESGHFNVDVVINFLNDTKPADRFMKASISRIIDAVRNGGYTVDLADGRYYIYR